MTMSSRSHWRVDSTDPRPMPSQCPEAAKSQWKRLTLDKKEFPLHLTNSNPSCKTGFSLLGYCYPKISFYLCWINFTITSFIWILYGIIGFYFSRSTTRMCIFVSWFGFLKTSVIKYFIR